MEADPALSGFCFKIRCCITNFNLFLLLCFYYGEGFPKFRSESQYWYADAAIFQEELRPENRGAQFAYDAISSQNLLRSMLPPETIATIGPLPAFPPSAAATGKAPAPSEIIRAFSAIKRIAFFVSSKLTTI